LGAPESFSGYPVQAYNIWPGLLGKETAGKDKIVNVALPAICVVQDVDEALVAITVYVPEVEVFAKLSAAPVPGTGEPTDEAPLYN
jgi:hypothetical protein